MKRILLLFISMTFFALISNARILYWVGTTGLYSATSNWNTSPLGTGTSAAPTNADSLMILRNATVTLDVNNSNLQPSFLWIDSNAVVSFTANSAKTLVIGTSTVSISPAFKIAAGSRLNIIGSSAITINMNYAACEIYGILDFSGNNSKMDYFSGPVTSGKTTIKPGGKIRYGGSGSNVSSNGTGTRTTLILDSGSVYEVYKNGGSFPTGTYHPYSLIRDSAANANAAQLLMSSTTGSYGNYEFHCPDYSGTAGIGNANITVNNFSLIDDGTTSWIFTTNPSRSYTLTINGNLLLNAGSKFDFNSAVNVDSSTTVIVKGNIENNGLITSTGTFSTGSIGKFNFEIGGSISSTISSVSNGFGGDISFKMNKSTGGDLIALTDINLPSSSRSVLTFIKGNIDVKTNNKTLFVQNAAMNALLTGNNTSHVIGKLKRKSSSVIGGGYIFPVSDNGTQLAKALITVTNANATDWTVEFISPNPDANSGLTPGTIDQVSDYYWNINKNGTSNASYITLYYDSMTNSTVANPASVKVLRFNNTVWTSLGGTNGGGSVDNSIGTSGNPAPPDSVTVFGRFAIGGVNGTLNTNPLCITDVFVQDTLRICGSSTTLDAGFGYSSYSWNTGALSQTISASINGWYKVTLNTGTCIGSDSVFLITNVLTLDTSLTFISPTTFCQGDSVVLSAASSLTYQWLKNNIPIAGAINRNYAAKVAGNYSVIISSGFDCIDTSRSITITINPPSSLPSVNSPVVYCLNATAIPLSAAGTNLSWYLGASGGTGSPNPPTPSTTIVGNTSYYVSQSGVNGCSSSRAEIVVTVNDAPQNTPVVSSPVHFCQGSNATPLTATGSGLLWFTVSAGGTGSATAPTPSTASANNTTYYVCETLGNCQGPRAAIVVTIDPAGTPIFDNIPSSICSGGLVPLLPSVSINGISGIWNPPTISNTTTEMHTFTPNAGGSCASSVTLLTSVYPNPYVNKRYVSINVIESKDVQLAARPLPDADYLWTNGNGLNNYAIDSPIFNNNIDREFWIKITTAEGCKITDTLLVRMFKKVNIFVPGGFSPNGDGKNDILTPEPVGIKHFNYFKVYNRWGQLVFQTTEFGKGWNGFYKGVKQPIETYMWIAEGIDIYGNLVKRSGTTILLK